MGLLSKAKEVVSDLVGDMFAKVNQAGDKVHDLASQIVTWERRREQREAEKGVAYATLLDMREKEEEGQADPQGLAAAQAQVQEAQERIDTCSRKILALHDEFMQAILAEAMVRSETAVARLDALEEERRAVLPRLNALLSEAQALQDAYFKGNEQPTLNLDPAAYQSEIGGSDFLRRYQEAMQDARNKPGSAELTNFCMARSKSLLKEARHESN